MWPSFLCCVMRITTFHTGCHKNKTEVICDGQRSVHNLGHTNDLEKGECSAESLNFMQMFVWVNILRKWFLNVIQFSKRSVTKNRLIIEVRAHLCSKINCKGKGLIFLEVK